MNLILIRHSQTIDSKDWAGEIKLRPLSKVGIFRVQIFSKFIVKRYFHNFEYIFSSEYTRSIQTAEILKNNLKPNRFVITSSLNPEKDITEFLLILKKLPRIHKIICAVGHYPYIANLINHLTGQPKEDFHMKKPSMVEIDIDEHMKGKVIVKFNFDDNLDNKEIPIKRSSPYKETIEELELP